MTEVDKAAIERMLRETAEALIQGAETLDSKLRMSPMTPAAEQLWFGERRRERIDFLRSTAERMRRSAADQLFPPT
jgi:hypothetical protein